MTATVVTETDQSSKRSSGRNPAHGRTLIFVPKRGCPAEEKRSPSEVPSGSGILAIDQAGQKTFRDESTDGAHTAVRDKKVNVM